jgi:hypothetical protein
MAAQLSSMPYILRNISTVLYAKMKGIPGTVDQDVTAPDELVIGIGTAELTGSRIGERQPGKSFPCDPSFVRREARNSSARSRNAAVCCGGWYFLISK